MRLQQIVARTTLCGLSATVLLATGCASIVGGVQQSVAVATVSDSGQNVMGAACKLENAKGTWYVTTPGHVTIHRAVGALSISCSKADQPFGSTVVPSSARGWLFGNVLFGGFIGLGVDIGTGAGFSYKDHYTIISPRSWTPSTPVAVAKSDDTSLATSYPIQASPGTSFVNDAPGDTIPELPAAMRYVASGASTMIAAHADEAKLCDIDAPLPDITVLAYTQHGTLNVKQGGFAAPDDQAAAACTSGFLYGAQILYRANPGFHGLDHVRYEAVINGHPFARNIDITVK